TTNSHRLRQDRDKDSTTWIHLALALASDHYECRISAEYTYIRPVEEWSAARARGGGAVHRCRIEHGAADPRLGAVHRVELPLLFGSYGDAVHNLAMAGTGDHAASPRCSRKRVPHADLLRSL
ncbi:hypothetical protein AB0D24_44105, partial [Streptomyces javensis]